MEKTPIQNQVKIKASEIPDFDFAKHLDTEERIAAYLDAILQDDNIDLLIASLGDIARARGMAYVSEKTNISREALYRALQQNKKPRFETVSKVCSALGLRLTVQRISQQPAT